MSCYGYDSYQVAALILIPLIVGGVIGGYIGYSYATQPPPKIVHYITVGCYRINATAYTQRDLSKPIVNITQITVNSDKLVVWPPFLVTQGTYPNGTQWAKLQVNC